MVDSRLEVGEFEGVVIGVRDERALGSVDDGVVVMEGRVEGIEDGMSDGWEDMVGWLATSRIGILVTLKRLVSIVSIGVKARFSVVIMVLS